MLVANMHICARAEVNVGTRRIDKREGLCFDAMETNLQIKYVHNPRK
jgi:hypothetical protein